MKNPAVLNEEVKSKGIYLKENELKKIADKPQIIKAVLYFLFGLATGLFPKSYIVSPFGCAAVASAESFFSPFVLFGAAVGFILTRGMRESIRHIVTMLFVFFSVRVAEKRLISFDKAVISAVPAAAFILLSDVLDMIMVRFSVTGAVLCISDALIAASATYFFSRSFCVPVFKIGIRKISNYDAICICITAACVLCCVGKINLNGFYLFHIPACILILFCAFYGRVAGGSISGILLGLVLSFGCEMPPLFYMYAAGGLVAGVFSFLNRYACALSFLISSCAAVFIGEPDIAVTPLLIECISAAVIFMLLPEKWISGAQEYLTKSALKNDSELNFQVALTIKDAAKTVESIRDVIFEANDRTAGIPDPELSKVFARIQHSVCTDCENKAVCWNECFDSTVSDICKIAKTSLNARTADYDALSENLKNRCRKIDSLSQAIDKDYKQYIASTDTRIMLDEMRNTVFDQFSSLSDMLSDIAALVADEKVYDENRSRALKALLKENNITADNVSCRENSFSRVTVEIRICEEPNRINTEKIRKMISAELKIKFREAEISVEDLHTVLTFRQKSEYNPTIGVKQLPCGENKVCGDFVETFDIGGGFTAAIISDGMGTGKRAAIDAQLACSIMSRLLCTGFSFNSAIKVVNSALLIRDGDESMSTLDVFLFNSYNATGVFYKAGASASYIRQGENIITVEEPSLPVGILRSIDFSKNEYRLGSGDIILLTSDGARGEDDGFIKETLLCWSTDNMQELATHIADKAKMKNAGSLPDDISVIAIKIKKR